MEALKNLLGKYVERSTKYRSDMMLKNNMPLLSIKQFHYIDTIKKLKNPNLTNLAKELNITKASASEVISKLIELNYLKKTIDANDKRSFILTLTKQGKEISKISHDANGLIAKELESKLSSREITSLKKILKKGI